MHFFKPFVMVKDFLATPASLVPVERQFSRAAFNLTKSRNRLDYSVMYLKLWMANKNIKDLFKIFIFMFVVLLSELRLFRIRIFIIIKVSLEMFSFLDVF